MRQAMRATGRASRAERETVKAGLKLLRQIHRQTVFAAFGAKLKGLAT